MPYITCKDGEVYSRYDTSQYVNNCIIQETQERIEVRIACDKDVECSEGMGLNYVVGGILLTLIVATLIITLVGLTSNELQIKDKDN